MIRMVGFDLDGTLCDSILLCIESFVDAVSPYTDHELSDKEVTATFGLNEIGMVKAIVNENWEKALQDFYSNYERLHNDYTTPFFGINELISFLKENHIRVVLITGKSYRSCNFTLKKIGLDEVFDDIYYGSEICQNNKDQAMLTLMKKYSINKNEFVYVGDTIADIEACNKAGIICLSAAWQELNNPNELRNVNPLYVFERVKNLRDFFKELIITHKVLQTERENPPKNSLLD